MGKILVVEDTELVRRVIQTYLDRLGYRADFAADDQEAVELFWHGDYDLVLMDCQLPSRDGVEVFRCLRRRGGRGVPVIALSASTSEAKRCIEAGMDDFLIKPFTCEQLAEILARWLPGAEKRVEATGNPGFTTPDQGMQEAAVIALEEYEKNGAQRLERIIQAVRSFDLGEVARSAHAFRPLNAYLGAERMVKLLMAMEGRAKKGDASCLPGLLEELLQEYERVKSELPEIGRRLRRCSEDDPHTGLR